MGKKEEIFNLFLRILLFFIVVCLIRKLNFIASLISEGFELTILLSMIQWIIPLIVFILMKKEGMTINEIGFYKGKWINQILIGFGMAALLVCTIYVIPSYLLGKLIVQSSINMNVETLIYLISVSVAEEILFRGYIYEKINKINKSEWSAIFISSFIFGIFHVFGSDVFQIISAIIMGMFICICKLKIKNCTLLSLILAHAMYDFIVVQMFAAL